MAETYTAEQYAALKAELAALQAKVDSKKAQGFKLGIGQKGTVNILGLRRFPIGLYAKELQAILANSDKIAEFIAANHDSLSWEKGDKDVVAPEYTDSDRTADYKLMRGETKGTTEQVAFATARWQKNNK